MSYAIEVAGEANPLGYQNVTHTLSLAASSNQQSVRTATVQLQNWQKQPSYHSFLQVGLDPSFAFVA